MDPSIRWLHFFQARMRHHGLSLRKSGGATSLDSPAAGLWADRNLFCHAFVMPPSRTLALGTKLDT